MKFHEIWSINGIKQGKYFLQKLSGKWVTETSSIPLFIFWKTLISGKRKWCAAYFQYISIGLNFAYHKNKPYKTLDYWVKDMLNFNFSEKRLGLVSSPHIVYDFSGKMFLMLHSVNWLDFIIWLPLLLKILELCVSQLFVCLLWHHEIWN